MQAWVFYRQPEDIYRAGRTVRSLEAAGIPIVDDIGLPSGTTPALPDPNGGLLVLRAGAWLVSPAPWRIPPPSATGLGLCLVGMPRTVSGQPTTEPVWKDAHARTGGDFQAAAAAGLNWQGVAAAYLDARAVAALARAGDLASFFRRGLAGLRVAHYAPLDVYEDGRLRVPQILPALHRGGAERVTLSLGEELGSLGTWAPLATIGQPLRRAFDAPPGTIELGSIPQRRERFVRLNRRAVAMGIDLVHAHLVTGEETRWLSAGGLPLAMTVHNTRPGWPRGLADLGPTDASLLVGCAQAVESDMADCGLEVPTRAVWNGIDPASCVPTPERIERARGLRREWGFAPEDLILATLANPRPQKGLDLMPVILQATQNAVAQHPHPRAVRWVCAGEPVGGNSEAQDYLQSIVRDVEWLGLEADVRWLGSVADVGALLAAVDVLVSPSLHEGLSLAHLEALAAGKPVLATDVGGTRELARACSKLQLIGADALPERYAEALAPLAQRPPPPGLSPFPVEFTRAQMARRYQWLYPRAIIAARRQRGAGIWLLTNNFSVGGAQTSARRLLLGLRDQGIPVRAIVVQEAPENPTPGRRALARAGVTVLSIPAATAMPSLEAVQCLLTPMDNDPSAAIVFWNLVPWIKILVADACLKVPVYDVSPGEMYYASLEKYFAQPLPGVPYLEPRDFGRRLAGVMVKYQAEAARARQVLGTQVRVIPNGLPVPEIDASVRKPSHLLDGLVVFGTAARIHRQKRLEELLEATRLAHPRLPPYRLEIAGGAESDDEAYAARLRALADGLPVVWLGEREAGVQLFQRWDVFVMISHPAGCPNASLEAMASGLPVIATDFGGASEQVIDGLTGRLVPDGAPGRFAEAMVELAAHPALRQRLGMGSHRHALEHFSLDRMLAEYRLALGLLPESGMVELTSSASPDGP